MLNKLEHAQNMVLHRFHWQMEHSSMLLRAPTSLEIHYISRDHPNAHELTNHIRQPSPEPGVLSSGAPGKRLRDAHAVLDCSSVTYRDNSKFSQNTLNGNNIENRFPVVKLVCHA